ncbi:MAG: YggU family protein [Nitrospira sp.]|nr:YggU family protein [Nitrospira sp.]
MTTHNSWRESKPAAAEQVVRTTPEGAVISVHVQPKASRTQCAGLHGHAIKIRVAAPPADGAANEELCRFLSRTCGLPLSAVEILSGASSRQKRILVRGRSAEQVRAQLQLE